MISFPRILFPVDLSPQSRVAAPFVEALAKRFRSEVILLHVVEVPPAWYGGPDIARFNAMVDTSSILEDRRNELEAFVTESFARLPVQKCVQSGDPAVLIHEFSRQKQVDLIMMPTHGYGPIRSLLLGSVTAKILHDARGPVWTVTHPGEMAVHPEAPWRRMLCAVDADSRDVSLVRWAAQFASEQGVEVRLVHAVTGFEELPGADADDPLREFLFDVARERIAKLQADAGTKLQVSIATGRTGEVVRKIALQRQADLVLVGRGTIQKPLGRLRSNAYAIVRDAPCPVISV